MLSEIIQRSALTQANVTFSLKSGKELSGIVIEIGNEHITLKNENGMAVLLIEMIGAFEVVEENHQQSGKKEGLTTHLPREEVVPAYVHQAEVTTDRPQELNNAVFKKIIEIEAQFDARILAVKLEYQEPEFVLPEHELEANNDNVAIVWNRVRDRYRYAKKIGEQDAKYGRIQPILHDLKGLLELSTKSAFLRRHIAYFQQQLGHGKEAISTLKEAAVLSDDANDWHNLAVLAIENKDIELASYSLEQFFCLVPIAESPDSWVSYVATMKQAGNYTTLLGLYRRRGQALQENELICLLETAIYLLKTGGSEHDAETLTALWIRGEDQDELITKALAKLRGQTNEHATQLAGDFKKISDSFLEAPQSVNARQSDGTVYKYVANRGFGFINDRRRNNYFFHHTAVADPTLQDQLDKWENGNRIQVLFESATGPKGPIALRVTLLRTLDQLFATAQKSANEGEYAQAIAYLRQVVDREPEYPGAKHLLENWRSYARSATVPRGSNPYARAKRAQIIEKDLERAAKLYREAVKARDNEESAVKDLATLYNQQGETQRAIDFLRDNRDKVHDQQSVDNMLIGFYKKAGRYPEAIDLLETKLSGAGSREKRAGLLWQMGNLQLQQDNYVKARSIFESVLKLHPDNLGAQRNIAICHFKLEQFEEAKQILNGILDASPDAKSAELLDAIKQAEATGKSTQIDEIIIETMLADFAGEISGFTRFLLERSEFQGVPPDRVQAEVFDRQDIKTLEQLATRLGTRRPRERAGYYLSAAKITSILQGENNDQFFRYLGRSFASSGDAVVAESKPLDAAREFYSEALSVYDRDRSKSQDEQDAVNALVRFLYSTLGQAQVPLSPRKNLSIDESIEEVLKRHPRPERVFEAIGYLIYRSKYAANRILKRLYSGYSLQAMACDYLSSNRISVATPIRAFDDFVGLWKELSRRRLDDERAISSELRFLKRVELTTSSLESGAERLKTISHRPFFDLDQERCRQLQGIFEATLDLVKQVSFEEQERLCIQVSNRCDDLSREIETSPTKLSVEEVLPVTQTIQGRVGEYLKELYASSIPQIELRLPVESYVPDGDRQLEVQIVAANKMGRSPAESLELVLQEDEDLFLVGRPEIRLDESLRGGEQRILVVPIKVTLQALAAQTFSLPMYAQYRTRSGETEQTHVQNFAIRLYAEEEFEPINNPYAAYAEGGIVGDPGMFYGRDELIENITRAIQESRTQSKSIVVFGQKRAGKSSILHHLKTRLSDNKDLIIIDLGNIGSILDGSSSAPFLYQILWDILRKLQYAIEDLVEESNLTPIGVEFPSDTVFYEHPSPLIKFKDVLDLFKRQASRTEGWRTLRLVLLIDEFSYIYGLIERTQIPKSFMKNWKALLQENYFSVVLAGQDVMPKFKQRFPNEFGTTQDERVSYLRSPDAVRLIDEPIRINGESRFRERAVERILKLTAGSPFYIQIVCDRLVRYMNEKRAALVTEADVEQVANDLIRGVNALSLDKFDNLVNSGDTSDDAISDEDALTVLRVIAVNSETGPCNRNSISVETSTSLDLILDDLVNREVIERERERYYLIRVGLFQDWLIAH